MSKNSKAAKSSEVVPATPEATLTSLLRSAKAAKRKVGEINTEVREAVSNAVEHKHLHRGAFNVAKRLFAMPDEKLAECMYHLEHYLEVSGINERVKKVGALPLGDRGDNVVEMNNQQAAAE
jgi:hypothetical protein